MHQQVEGYKYGVLHEPLFEVFDDGSLRDLLEEDHVVHTARLNIVTLPVVRLQQYDTKHEGKRLTISKINTCIL